ncbi:thiol peroxidase [Muriicola sp. E247]|uniref:thiol peroxidase n=1 Tax=Muriicola sp. E247 TaxID=3242730 RepID=UPI003524CBDD
MALVKFTGTSSNTIGKLPAPGIPAPDFILTKRDLTSVSLEQFRRKNVVLNIFPSVDTSTCAQSVRTFNREAAEIKDSVVLCISKDLPFALSRFCGAEGIDQVLMLSDYKSNEFGESYGVTFVDGPFEGLLARAVVVINSDGEVVYTELVSSIGNEPNYKAALEALENE